jgi:hypothetical protein
MHVEAISQHLMLRTADQIAKQSWLGSKPSDKRLLASMLQPDVWHCRWGPSVRASERKVAATWIHVIPFQITQAERAEQQKSRCSNNITA